MRVKQGIISLAVVSFLIVGTISHAGHNHNHDHDHHDHDHHGHDHHDHHEEHEAIKNHEQKFQNKDKPEGTKKVDYLKEIGAAEDLNNINLSKLQKDIAERQRLLNEQLKDLELKQKQNEDEHDHKHENQHVHSHEEPHEHNHDCKAHSCNDKHHDHDHGHDHHDHDHHDHDHHGHDHHGHDHHGHGEGECPFAKQAKEQKLKQQAGRGLDDHHHHDHSHGHSHSHQEENIHVQLVNTLLKFTQAEKAFLIFNKLIRPLPQIAQALASTLFISIVPIFFIYGMNIMFLTSPRSRDSVICYLISFAIGGLLGDVFFHTLPHLNSGGNQSHSHAHSHDDGHGHGHSHDPAQMMNNLIIIGGIISFFLIEKLVENVVGGDAHNHSHDHSHEHSHEEEQKVESKGDKKGKKEGKKEKKEEKKPKKAEKSLEEIQKEKRYTSYAVMTLVGDFLHNFTDGLSIGVAYVANYKMGVVTTMAMFFHEIPHEVGDFAVLFQLKFGICKILGFQLTTAIGALIGTVIGSVIGQFYMNQCLAFTSGGFLYFAINGLLSELKQVNSIPSLILCLFSMALGLYFMFVFALFE